MTTKEMIKTTFVLIVLMVAIIFVGSFGSCLWLGFAVIGALIFVGIPIALLLEWWIKK